MKKRIILVLLLLLCVCCIYLSFELKNNDPYEIHISEENLNEDDVNDDSSYKVCRTDITQYQKTQGNLSFSDKDVRHIRFKKNENNQVCVKQGEIVKKGERIATHAGIIYRAQGIERVINITDTDVIDITLLSYHDITCTVALPQDLINAVTYQSECYILCNQAKLAAEIVHISDTIHKKMFDVTLQVKDKEYTTRSGMDVQVFTLLSRKENVVAIPNSYIYHFENGDTAACVKHGESYTYKPISIGISDGKFTEILSGVSENDVVYENLTYSES